MSASASFSILYISRGVMSSIMWASSPISSLIFCLSSRVDFFTLVPTISMPTSCSAETTDQDFTPPVMSSTFTPLRRSLWASIACQKAASSRWMMASVRVSRSAGAPFSTRSFAMLRRLSLMSEMP